MFDVNTSQLQVPDVIGYSLVPLTTPTCEVIGPLHLKRLLFQNPDILERTFGSSLLLHVEDPPEVPSTCTSAFTRVT